LSEGRVASQVTDFHRDPAGASKLERVIFAIEITRIKLYIRPMTVPANRFRVALQLHHDH